MCVAHKNKHVQYYTTSTMCACTHQSMNSHNYTILKSNKKARLAQIGNTKILHIHAHVWHDIYTHTCLDHSNLHIVVFDLIVKIL